MTEDIKDVIERVRNAGADVSGTCLFITGADRDAILAHITDLTRERDEALDEVEEQARLNGMGAERELALRAEVERLTRERNEARRDTREVSMFARHVAEAGPAAVEAMRARCEKIARTQEDEPDTSIASDIARIIADAIAALKIESGNRT